MMPDRPRRLLSSPGLSASLVGVAAFVVYCMTLAPSVSFIDSGELAAVAYTLGVAHPSGYPLFTLLGWLCAHLPLPWEEILRLNLMAALFSAVGTGVFFLVARRVLRMVSSGEGPSRGGPEKFLLHAASAGAALLLGFSETYWAQAQAVEVYSLHALFLSLVLLLGLRAAYPPHNRPGQVSWIIFAFVVGLSFTNHMTTVLLAPGLIALYFLTQGTTQASWKQLGIMGVPFLVGLSVYLYLPIRSSAGPVLDWGHPTTPERLLWHLGGGQYRVWLFSSTEVAGRQLRYFTSGLPAEFAYLGVVAAAIGLVLLMARNRSLLLVIVLLFAACVAYSINYDIHDIDSYFLLAYFCVALLAGVGLYEIGAFLRKHIGKVPLAICMLLPAAFSAWYHFDTNNERGNYLVEDYTMNMFRSVDSNAVVLSYQWDYFVSASYYYQLVKGYRPDVTVIDKELLRRSWYLDQLERVHPALIHQSINEVEAFRKELYKFEHDLPYNAAVIQARFVAMISGFLRKSMENRPVYVTPEIEPEFTAGMQRVPSGLAFRLYEDTLRHPPPDISYKFRPFEARIPLATAIHNFYSSSLTARGIHYYRAGMADAARGSFREALKFAPSAVDPRQWLDILEREKQVEKAPNSIY
jgi:Protein O-mannosyl-transferase TMEM260-like